MNLLVYITTPDEENALLLAYGLVEAGLAAGVNISGPVHSVYRWKGQIKKAREWQLFAQASAENFRALKEFTLARHPHRTPCVIACEIKDGHKDFLNWIKNGGHEPCILP